MSIRDESLNWYLSLATHPEKHIYEGLREHVWYRVKENSKDVSGLFTDFDKEFLKALDERKANA